MVDESPRTFYDALADDYHLIFADWDASIVRQARIIATALDELGLPAGGSVLDASCGIGTQAIGLATSGFTVTATDISPASVDRCAREAARRGIDIATAVADLRALRRDVVGSFDAVICFDNALPHLLDDADLDAACKSIRDVLRPEGVFLASVRDYDAILRDRPTGDPPRRFVTADGERIVFQVWDWTSDDRYTLSHFILDNHADMWTVSEHTTAYRALTRATIADALDRAGFTGITWRMPEQTGFYQPIVTARVP